MLEVEVDIDVVVEERGGTMVGGEGDVGVVDACVDLSLEGGQERDDGEVLRCCERASDAHRKVRVVYERKDPQHTQFCRET